MEFTGWASGCQPARPRYPPDMEESASLGELIQEADRALENSPNPRQPREAERLVFAATGLRETDLIGFPERTIAPERVARFREILKRRIQGEPIQYILGEWDFFGRPFLCDPRALIPRPETELIIEFVKENCGAARSLLDLGTGTGALAVTASLELTGVRVVGIDLSAGAVALARRNSRRLGSEARFFVSDWDQGLSAGAGFDVVVSNPPYIDEREAFALAPEVRDHEPHLALFAPGDPSSSIREVVDVARRRLLPAGWLVFEMGIGQAAEAESILRRTSGLDFLEVRTDLAGIPRIAVAKRSGGW